MRRPADSNSKFFLVCQLSIICARPHYVGSWLGELCRRDYFAVFHLNEWRGLIGEGVRLFQNPWGSPMFGASFFAITGLHLTHVIGGVIALTVVALGYKRGRYNSDDIEVWSLYWHFVDLVWMFIFPLVYLLSVNPK